MELSKSKFNQYASLSSGKMRQKYGLFTIEGEKAISDSIDGFEPEAIILTKGKNKPDFVCADVPVYEATESEIRKLSNLTTPASIIAVFRLPDQNRNDVERVDDGLYVVLDGVRDPGNLGTIVRTCHWFGIYRIFASRDTVDIFNPKTVQSTMGSLAHVRVEYCDLTQLFQANRHLPVYGTLLDGENIFRTKLDKKGFIVMGNEGKGISPAIREYITDPLLIPPAGKDHSESLNVAIATAITIAQFQK